MENKEYSSDSEQSDEDYCPTKDDANGANEVSEDDSDGDPISDEDTKGAASTNTKLQPRRKSSNKKSTNNEKTVSNEDKSHDKNCKRDATDDKAHVDALWADFLFETDTAYTKKTEPKTEKQNVTTDDTTKISQIPVDKQIITEQVEFAGETIDIKKEIVRNIQTITTTPIVNTGTTTAEQLTSTLKKNQFSPTSSGFLKRPNASGVGLSSILGQIAKKNKISVLEKTKLDWNSFKRNEGIDEQLQTHNKGKDGYLERQDFLERTDLRQFEIEKNLRQTNRKSNR